MDYRRVGTTRRTHHQWRRTDRVLRADVAVGVAARIPAGAQNWSGGRSRFSGVPDQASGKRPVGVRAPSSGFSPQTFDLIRKAGFLYDSSLLAADEPYEIVSNGQPSGVIELPISEVDNDYVYYGETANGSLPSPDAVFEIYKAEFDLAFQERTIFILTQHPHVGGRRSHIVQLDRLITYIKSKRDVWFATMERVAQYVKQTGS